MDQSSTTSSHHSILIMDESLHQLQGLIEFLASHGYQVESVTQGTSGLESAIASPPDLILLESRLPDMTGHEVCQVLKSKPETQNIPIIFISSVGEELDKVNAFEVGGCDYIAKPIALLETVSRIKYQLKANQVKHQTSQADQLHLLQSAVVHARDAIVITNAQTEDHPTLDIIFVNQAFTDLTGYEAQEILGRSPKLLQGPKTSVSTRSQIRASLEKWAPIETEILNYTKDGTEFWIEVSITPLKNRQGLVTHWMAIQRDISERKEAEKEILRELQQENELNELKSNFFSMVSHEYRAPLATILSSTDLLEFYDHCSSAEEKRQFFSQIRTAIDRMTNLLNKVIENSSLHHIPFQPSPLDIKHFCENFVKEFQKESPLSHHQIQFTLKGSNTEGWMDQTLLTSILTNLISNAVKYSPQGGTIKFDVVCHDQTAMFSIQDSGLGIPADAMQHLFQSFYRADNVNEIEGSGLGLSIVKQFVKSHGGEIECESQLGKGSNFKVTIPLNLDTRSN